MFLGSLWCLMNCSSADTFKAANTFLLLVKFSFLGFFSPSHLRIEQVRNLFFFFFPVGNVIACVYLSSLWLYLRISIFHFLLTLLETSPVSLLSLRLPSWSLGPCCYQCRWCCGPEHQGSSPLHHIYGLLDCSLCQLGEWGSLRGKPRSQVSLP